MSTELPSLRMGFRRFAELAPPSLPAGYGLRTYRPGDEDAWLAILAAGEFGVWDRPRLDRMLAGERAPLPRDGIFFATQDDEPVGTACVFFHPSENGDVAEVGWVAVRPEDRGHHLAREICRAALAFIRDRGHDYAYLLTEDFRLPAIKTYLSLGFQPELTHPSHAARWAGLATAAGRSADPHN
ncbi:MAG TPA: GNAT family N-acetyltransferase [Chloroflexota bacterium]|nr:GNAT family N-acetyltransferase [Chloroflexota bacterium]